MTLPKPFHADSNREVWKFVGPDVSPAGMAGCRGRIHIVAMVQPHEIVTLGIGNAGKPDHSWIGSVTEFVSQFQYAGGA